MNDVIHSVYDSLTYMIIELWKRSEFFVHLRVLNDRSKGFRFGISYALLAL